MSDRAFALDSGIVASNIACDLWLVNLSHTDRQLDLGKDMMNIVANTFIGIAGLNGAGATSLARASLGLCTVSNWPSIHMLPASGRAAP